MLDLSISIVNFNTKELIRRCLNSIHNAIKGLNYEIIVVDNNSSDGSVDMLKNEFPHVKLIVNQDNLGASIAKNQSFKAACGKYVLVLDSDIEILPDAVNKLFDYIEANANIGIVSARVLFSNLRPQHSCNKSVPNLLSVFMNKFFLFASLRYKFYKSKLGSIYLKARFNKPEEFSWLGGMCFLTSMEVIKQLGGIDEGYFIYYDDTDFCLRAKKAGWKVMYLPFLLAIHHMGAGVKQAKFSLYTKIFESELHFFKKHYGKLGQKIFLCFVQMAMILRIIIMFHIYLLGIKRFNLGQRMHAYFKVLSMANKEIYAKGS
jgi:GT2 family glycosyltransferase